MLHHKLSDESAQHITAAGLDVDAVRRLISVALDRKQPEFFEKTYEYLEKRVDDKRIQSAKNLLKENSALLEKVNTKFKVDKEILVALWGIETNFGVNKGKVCALHLVHPIMQNLVRVALMKIEPCFQGHQNHLGLQ